MRQQRTKQKAHKAAKEAAADQPHDTTAPEPKSGIAASFADPKNILWVILSAGMAITVVGSQFLTADTASGGLTSSYSAMLWVGIFGAALARYIGKNGWIGFAIGSVLGIVLNMIASLI